MKSTTFWKWPALVAAGLLLSAGGIAMNKTSPDARSKAQSHSQPPISTSPSGEKTMSATQTKRSIEHADDATFGSTVLNSKIPVLVDFYADWCGPCRRLAPVLEDLATENPHVKIVKVNVDDSPNVASEYGVDSIPSLKLFRNGSIAGELVGLASKGELRALLSR